MEQSIRYMLEHMQESLTGGKRSAGLALMYEPWQCPGATLREYVPAGFAAQFERMQGICKAAILEQKPGTVALRLAGIGLFAYAELAHAGPASLRGAAEAAAEQFAGQIREDLHRIGRSYDALSDSDRSAFLFLYALSETALYMLCGLIESDGEALRLTTEPSLLLGYRLYWLGHYWAQQSLLGDFFLRKHVRDQILESHPTLEAGVRARTTAFRELVYTTLDKYSAIHPHFTDRLGREDRAHYAAIVRRVELICYLFLKNLEATINLAGTDFNPAINTELPGDFSMGEILAAGFHAKDVTSLLDDSSRLPVGDRILVRLPAGPFKLASINLKYACNLYLKDWLTDMKSRGDWFEHCYIYQYLASNLDGERYILGRTVAPKSKSEGSYDIDLVIADTHVDRIYFCQIKHRASTMYPFLRDELKAYSTDEQLRGAIRQLTGVRQHLRSTKFLEKVRDSLKRGGDSAGFLARIKDGFLEDHSGLIVIHTVESLDFALKEGIALYEWNTFRNLLKGRLGRYSSQTGALDDLRLPKVSLDRPLDVANALVKASMQALPDVQPHADKEWEARSTSHLAVSPFWELHLFGRKLWSWYGRVWRTPML